MNPDAHSRARRSTPLKFRECINGNHWAQHQAGKAGIGFTRWTTRSPRSMTRPGCSRSATGSDPIRSTPCWTSGWRSCRARSPTPPEPPGTGMRNHTQRGILRTFDTRLGTEDGPVDKMWVLRGGTPDGRGRATGSDLKSHANDRLSDRAQAGVVVAGVPAHELVGVIDRNRFPLRRDPLGLFEDDP